MAAEPVHSISEALLNRAHSPDTASTIHREKVKQRPLILRPSSPNPTLNARSKRQYERFKKTREERKAFKKKNKPAPLSAKQKRALCLYEIPKSQRKYSIYKPLHKLWSEYMREVLGLQVRDQSGAAGEEKQASAKRTWIDAQGAGQLLVTADYHGAMVEVVRSRCVSRVGVRGIVVKETKFTFDVVTTRNEIKTIPKEGTIFKFEVPLEDMQNEQTGEEAKSPKPILFEIHGDQFEARGPDRAAKKFRQHFDPDL